MAVEKIEAFKIVCDGCGRDFLSEEELFYYDTAEEAYNMDGLDDWQINKDQVLCPDCKWDRYGEDI